LYAAVLASALAMIDGSVVAIATPAMRESLGGSLTDAQWISNAYLLPLASLILLGGAAGDRYGLRRVFSGGIAVFVVASILCAMAWNVESLIAFRIIKGIGAAFMIPSSLAIIAKAYPKAERGKAIGTWAAASAITTALGPIIGGFVLAQGGPEIWRLLFAINLPLGGIALWMLLTKVPQDKHEEHGKLDISGALLAIIFLGALAWSLTGPEGEGGTPSGRHILVWLSVSLIGFLAFIYVERRAASPIMPLHVFSIQMFNAANIATFSLYFGLSAVLFYLPMTLIGGWQFSEAQVGLLFVPLTIAIAGLSGPVGSLADKTGPGIFITAGSAIVAVAYAILAIGMEWTSFWFHIFPSVCLMAFGMGLVVAPLSAAIMGAVDDDDTGTASGVNNAISRVAGLVAVASMGGLATWSFARSGAPGDFGLPLVQGADAVHLAAHNAAFAAVAWFSAAMSAISAIVAWIGVRIR
jgi:EmrB/QacA subfamily drug resistance transporter